jgi:hypothetical protein
MQNVSGPLVNRLLNACVAVISICAMNSSASCQRFTYEQASGQIVDAARIVPPNDFTQRNLHKIFEAFVVSECAATKLCRLIVAPTQSELAAAANSNLPSPRSAETDRPQRALLQVAQVVSFNGNATAWIRRGTYVSTVQISGRKDAREWAVGGAAVRVVGFRVRADPSAPTNAAASPSDRVWLYAKAYSTIEPSVAIKLRRNLEQLIGMPTYLILRTDSFFSEEDGPLRDVFEDIDASNLKSSALADLSLICRPGRSGGTCESYKSKFGAPAGVRGW